MITAVIIDDEAHGRLALREKLKLFCPEVVVLAEADNGRSGLEIIHKFKPGLIFLDVEMPVMSGFELLSNLKGPKGHVVFTTAYNQYAIKAIKHAALDYFLKPIDIEELKTTVQKAVDTEIKDDRKVISNPNKSFTKLAVASLEGLQFLNIADILHLEADSNYTTFYMRDGTKLISSKSMIEYESILEEHNFFRCHHSHLINMECVSKYLKNDGGQIQLSNGTLVDISRRKKKEFLDRVSGE